MDLDPTTGQYRFTANVPSVEMNDLRRTLGIKPLPMPFGGALRGVLHCTGPLEQPVFTGQEHFQPGSPYSFAAFGQSDKSTAIALLSGQYE